MPCQCISNPSCGGSSEREPRGCHPAAYFRAKCHRGGKRLGVAAGLAAAVVLYLAGPGPADPHSADQIESTWAAGPRPGADSASGSPTPFGFVEIIDDEPGGAAGIDHRSYKAVIPATHMTQQRPGMAQASDGGRPIPRATRWAADPADTEPRPMPLDPEPTSLPSVDSLPLGDDSTHPYLRPPFGWYGGAEALWLDREEPEEIILSQDLVGATVLDQVSADDLSFRPIVGVRTWLGRQLDRYCALEGSYFGSHHWLRANQLTRTGTTLDSPYLANSAVHTSHRLRHASQFRSADIGLRTRCNPPGWCASSWTTGLRFLRLREDAQLGGFIGGAEDERTTALTTNTMMGWQVGGELAFHVTDATEEISFRLSAIAAVLGNQAESRVRNVRNPNAAATVLLDRSRDDVALASLVELGAWLSYRCRNLAVRLGYEVLVVNGLALAPEQFLTTGTDIADGRISPRTANAVRDDQSAVFHGPYLGFELSFPAGVR